GDADLDLLESQAVRSNQQLKAAVARVEQARAVARVARSELLPALNADPSWTRQRFSPNQEPSFGPLTANTFRAPLDLSYEIDLWGRVRRSFQSARAEAQASFAEFYNVLLTLQADVAQNYFALRALDAEIATVSGTVNLRKEQVRLVRSRFVSGDIDSLFNWESRTWSIGPSLSLPIFAGGRNRANYNRSQASFDEAVARYRQQVLIAFGEVENSLSGIRHLVQQAVAQQRAVANARRAAELATDRYRSGIVSYLEVVDASREALQAERANAQLAGQRLIAAVQLIKALGGGWTEQQVLANATSRDARPQPKTENENSH